VNNKNDNMWFAVPIAVLATILIVIAVVYVGVAGITAPPYSMRLIAVSILFYCCAYMFMGDTE